MSSTEAPLPKPDAVADLERSAASASRLMKLLSNQQRLLLLCRLLLEGECSVLDLAAYAGLAQSAASQHLAKLRADGLVSTRRDAQTIYYRLSDPAAIKVLGALCDIYQGGRR